MDDSIPAVRSVTHKIVGMQLRHIWTSGLKTPSGSARCSGWLGTSPRSSCSFHRLRASWAGSSLPSSPRSRSRSPVVVPDTGPCIILLCTGRCRVDRNRGIVGLPVYRPAVPGHLLWPRCFRILRTHIPDPDWSWSSHYPEETTGDFARMRGCRRIIPQSYTPVLPVSKKIS